MCVCVCVSSQGPWSFWAHDRIAKMDAVSPAGVRAGEGVRRARVCSGVPRENECAGGNVCRGQRRAGRALFHPAVITVIQCSWLYRGPVRSDGWSVPAEFMNWDLERNDAAQTQSLVN